MAGKIDARLAELGIELPEPVAPVANYVPYVVAGNLIFIAGQITLALEADDSLAAVWVNLGVNQRRRGRFDDSEASYLRALELDPNEISAASNLAGLYQATGRARLAAPYLKKVKKHRRKNPFYHFRRGLEASAVGDLHAAGRRLKRAVRLLPDDAMFRVELGKVQARAGRPRKAERNLEKALELTADESQRMRLRGLLENIGAGAA